MYGDGGDEGMGFSVPDPDADSYQEMMDAQTPPPSPPSPKPRQRKTTLGASSDMGYIASFVDSYVTTPEFLNAQVTKIVNSPQINDEVGRKVRPYVFFTVGAALALGFVGAWALDKYRSYRSNPLVRGIKAARRMFG